MNYQIWGSRDEATPFGIPKFIVSPGAVLLC